MKVLIAEDDMVSRIVLEANLKKWGYDVIVTTNGQDAWEVAQENDISIAVLDWMMPKMDGLEVCRKIRERENVKYTYVLFLTARERKADIITGFEAGADDYVSKPFHQEELRSRIKVGERVVTLERDLQAANEKLQILAVTDSLTKVQNRGAIIARLIEELSRSKREKLPLGLIMLDIDHFKMINDKYGHLAGDRVLVELSARLRGVCRPYDVVGRYGGEEFLVLLPGTDEAETFQIADRLHSSIRSTPVKIDTQDLWITVSAGAGSLLPEEGVEETQLIRAVDQALYQAKESGRDRVVQLQEMEVQEVGSP